MSQLSLPLLDRWHTYWNSNCDPRTVHFWLMNGGPCKLMIISLAYVLVIVIGRRMMRNRSPLEIRLPMLAYNIVLILINTYFLYQSFWWTNYGKDLFDFRFPSPHDFSARALGITQLYYYYLLSKFVDYFDTFFFILRKKNNQITALHVYHHISVPIVGWMSNWISPTMPVLGLFAMLNSFCHILMYAYYALAALGHKVRPYLWWKPYITQIQLVQFIIIGLYGILLNLLNQDYPLSYRLVPVSQAFIYLYLFGDFYYKSYKKTNLHKCDHELDKQD